MLAAALVAVGLVLRARLWAVRPQVLTNGTPAEAFRHGSIGTEDEEGLPYHLWRILPRVFAKHLNGPGGYRSFGMLWEEGQELPVGFSLKTVGFPRVGINCALCHTGSYRVAPDGPRHIVPGAPMTTFDAQSYLRFLAQCGADPAFDAEVLLADLAYDTDLDWLDRQLYRHLIIPRTREALLALGRRYAWAFAADWPRWGHGRIDPFNPVKYDERRLALTNDGSLGNSDAMPLWRLGGREGAPLHWDGLNDDMYEVFASGALGDGATHASVSRDHLNVLIDYCRELAPPPYPWPTEPPVRAAPPEFARCAECHVANRGRVVPAAEIGTDGSRLGMWSQAAADAYNAFDGASAEFKRFTNHEGYVAPPLDGLWLRAPYLHNGSVPTLEDLLAPSATPGQLQQLGLPPPGTAISPADVDTIAARARELGVRPPLFYRGSDLYAERGSGFVHGSAAAADGAFLHDVRVRGNHNAGHEGEAYGTSLTREQKRTLIAYLLTL